MEKETYKTAKELLEKYDPSHPSLRSSVTKEQTSGTELRQRRTTTPRTPAPLHPSQLHAPVSHPPITPRPPATPHSSARSQRPTNPPSTSSSSNTHSVPTPPVTPMKNVGVADNGLMESNKELFIPPGIQGGEGWGEKSGRATYQLM